jgi:hypothetical protein
VTGEAAYALTGGQIPQPRDVVAARELVRCELELDTDGDLNG